MNSVDGSGKGPGGIGRKKNHTCSFCNRTSEDAGPIVEGPNGVYICSNCVELCHNIIRQEKRRSSATRPLFASIPTPKLNPNRMVCVLFLNFSVEMRRYILNAMVEISGISSINCLEIAYTDG